MKKKANYIWLTWVLNVNLKENKLKLVKHFKKASKMSQFICGHNSKYQFHQKISKFFLRTADLAIEHKHLYFQNEFISRTSFTTIIAGMCFLCVVLQWLLLPSVTSCFIEIMKSSSFLVTHNFLVKRWSAGWEHLTMRKL